MKTEFEFRLYLTFVYLFNFVRLCLLQLYTLSHRLFAVPAGYFVYICLYRVIYSATDYIYNSRLQISFNFYYGMPLPWNCFRCVLCSFWPPSTKTMGAKPHSLVISNYRRPLSPRQSLDRNFAGHPVRWLVKILKHARSVLDIAASPPIPRPPLEAEAHALHEA